MGWNGFTALGLSDFDCDLQMAAIDTVKPNTPDYFSLLILFYFALFPWHAQIAGGVHWIPYL